MSLSIDAARASLIEVRSQLTADASSIGSNRIDVAALVALVQAAAERSLNTATAAAAHKTAQAASTTKSPFELLGVTVLEQCLLPYLEPRELCRLATCSTFLAAVASANSLWRPLSLCRWSPADVVDSSAEVDALLCETRSAHLALVERDLVGVDAARATRRLRIAQSMTTTTAVAATVDPAHSWKARYARKASTSGIGILHIGDQDETQEAARPLSYLNRMQLSIDDVSITAAAVDRCSVLTRFIRDLKWEETWAASVEVKRSAGQYFACLCDGRLFVALQRTR
jgi:hypothetical protein